MPTRKEQIEHFYSLVGTVRRKVLSHGDSVVLEKVGQRFLEIGVELTEQGANETPIESRGEQFESEADRKLRYRENDIQRLKKIIGEKNEHIAAMKAKIKELKATARALRGGDE